MLSPLHLSLTSGSSDFLSPIYTSPPQNPSYLPLDIQAVLARCIQWSAVDSDFTWYLLAVGMLPFNSKLFWHVKSPPVMEGPLLCRYMVWELHCGCIQQDMIPFPVLVLVRVTCSVLDWVLLEGVKF